jgi:VIT1/CCC1 family predicted Fe2+/Mn2+ transporter
VQAAAASAASFAAGSALPVLVAAFAPAAVLLSLVCAASLACLALLGAAAARMGGASIGTGVLRITFWGALAMAATAGVGALFGVGSLG